MTAMARAAGIVPLLAVLAAAPSCGGGSPAPAKDSGTFGGADKPKDLAQPTDGSATDMLVVDYVVELPPSDRYDPDMKFVNECDPVMQNCASGKKCDWACPERAYLCKDDTAPMGGTHGQACSVTK